jgi:hypothetical protein
MPSAGFALVTRQWFREEITMSVSGILSSNLFNYTNQTLQNSTKQAQQEFLQLGQDLQSGDLSAAQSDLATLEQLAPPYSSTTSAQGSSPIANAFNQLSQDLQAGNLSAAQKDYSALQLNFQSPAEKTLGQRQQARSASETPQTTGLGYLTPQQIYSLIQQELQQLHPTAGTIGFGLLTPQQINTLIQQEMQRLHQNAESNFAQNSTQTGSSGLSVHG